MTSTPALPTTVASRDDLAESDLAGYRIYRAMRDGPFEKVADVGPAPSFSDRSAGHSGKYRYAITAFDQTGNESPRTPAVDAIPE